MQTFNDIGISGQLDWKRIRKLFIIGLIARWLPMSVQVLYLSPSGKPLKGKLLSRHSDSKGQCRTSAEKMPRNSAKHFTNDSIV